MQLRSVPAGFAASVVTEIDARLADVEHGHDVRITLAIESGSRAWGFPSPDSDYDCRFVFVRPIEQHLSPWARRDVIETPVDALLDVNGWELGKALKLLLKGNAMIIDWLHSPIVYRGDAAFRDDLLGFATAFADRTLIGRHYLHLGERQRQTYFGDGRDVPLKKIFYALRPAATLRWLRLRTGEAIAPMHFPSLMAEVDAPADVVAIVADLVERKARTRELGSAPLSEPVRKFIDDEFERARTAFDGAFVKPTAQSIDAAEDLFRRHAWWLGHDRTNPPSLDTTR